MGFREADAVVATRDIASTVTGNAVSSGAKGVILKQVGSRPATYRVRFLVSLGSQRSLVLDDVTDHDIVAAAATN